MQENRVKKDAGLVYQYGGDGDERGCCIAYCPSSCVQSPLVIFLVDVDSRCKLQALGLDCVVVL